MFLARATARSLQRCTAASSSAAVAAALAPCRVAATPAAASAASAAASAVSWTPRRSAFSYPTPRSLDEIVKLPLLIPHSREEVVSIWSAHHSASAAGGAANSGMHVGTTAADDLTASEHDRFLERAKKAPLFVVPCFKIAAAADSSTHDTFDTAGGFENMLVNVQQSSLLLTSLEEYKLRGAAAATPYAVVTLYADMAASKDLVLVRAEMMDVNVAVPQLVAMWSLLKLIFTAEDPALFERFPRAFNKKPNPQFDFDAYISWCTAEVSKMRLPRAQGQGLGEQTTAAAEFVELDGEPAPKPEPASDKQ